MVSKTCVCVFVCVGSFIAFQTLLPKAAAKRTADVNEYTVENRRTDLRHNYVLGFDEDQFDEYGPKYEVPPPEEGPPPGEGLPPGEGSLPEFIVDYANMIRNDIILLDNSVETRTRKRGNIKLEKHSNQAISDVPCNCERNDVRKNVNLSEVWGTDVVYPDEVRNLTCDESRCARPYRCQKIIYNLTVLKKTYSQDERESAGALYRAMPNELKRKWVPKVVPVVTGCLCSSRYVSN